MKKIYDLFVIPENYSESGLNEFVKTAQELGLAGLCFCFDSGSKSKIEEAKEAIQQLKKNKNKDCEIFFGVIINETKKEKMIQKINQFRNSVDIIAAKAVNAEMQRAICENEKIDLLIRNYTFENESQKESYFDKIMTNLCKKNNIANTILFSDLTTIMRTKRAKYLNFVKTDLKLFRKQKAPIVVVSAAKSPRELKDEYSLLSIIKIFEKDSEFVKSVGNNTEKIIEKIKEKKSKDYISEGIKLSKLSNS